MQTVKHFEDDVKTGVSESFPGDLPAFADAAALGLSMDHDLAGMLESLRRYYDDLALALDVSEAGPANPGFKHYHRDRVRRTALETAAHALQVVRCGSGADGPPRNTAMGTSHQLAALFLHNPSSCSLA
ncbi:hypothetical protein [Megalodesulfovibrio gigas]|uniref:hypothetical protein n=1 Tax=Megalodesulfovibrio gigas TaxID=879 RepID=UPI00048A04AF|nr:hypothetical protein [Megalodesulfovibrio gigas]